MTSSQTIDLSSAIAYSNTKLDNIVCDTEPNVLIYWGDGTTPVRTDCKDPALLKHTYTEAKNYTIELRGTVAWFSTYKEDSSDCLSNFLTGITVPNRCPIRTFLGVNGTEVDVVGKGAFCLCALLTSIKGDLFNGSVTTKTNENWYDNFFWNCTKLKEIPENFYQSIKRNKIGLDICHYRSQFKGCSAITSIPSTLYSHFSEDITQVNQNGSFSYCTGLTDIPEDLISNLPTHVTAFDAISMFQYATSLTNIPPNLFNVKENVTFSDLALMFYNCSAITSAVPKLWEKYQKIHHISCFFNCTKASNYTEIPDDWKNKLESLSLMNEDEPNDRQKEFEYAYKSLL